MRGNNKLAALVAATMLVLTAFASGAVAAASAANTAGNSTLSVGVSQATDGSVTVTVTQNDTGVENASVNVTTVNGTYAGTGTYSTGPNGTVALPAPEENVTISVVATYNGSTAETTAELSAVNDSAGNATDVFGLQVKHFVHNVLANKNTTNESVGQIVSDWVTSHNPGAEKRPDHAGPDGNKTGRPDHAGPSGNETGRPDNAGPPEDKGGHGNSTAKGKSA